MRINGRTFSGHDQERFSFISGDRNPMHVDPVAARRTQAGTVVVHGVHALLWAMDALIDAGVISSPVSAIQVQFRNFIYVGAEATLNASRRSDGRVRASLLVNDLVTTTIEIIPGAATTDVAVADPELAIAEILNPAELDLESVRGCSGRLGALPSPELAQLFPSLSENLGPIRVAGIAKLSTVVGMVCPGLHSIFREISIVTAAVSDGPAELAYQVEAVDERFRLATIAVAGNGLRGTVKAFVRHPPATQRPARDLRGLVGDGEFRGTTALVLGGSRGLGALTARLIAAGGGQVIATYRVGEAEARELESEITAEMGAGACRIMQFDARHEAAGQLGGVGAPVNQLYYFATSQIFRQKSQLFAAECFQDFCSVYVDGFYSVCSALHRKGGPEIAVFYPSSVAVEQRPKDMTEYSMAKAAGEVLCADMNRFMPGLRIIVRRLPRLPTDQTASVMPAEAADAPATMLPIIREMHTLSRADRG